MGNIQPRWKPGESGNPAGRPKGSRNWATVIRELVENEEHPIQFANGTVKKYPAWVIADVMIRKAASGDVTAATWLVKSGYGDKLDVTSGGEKLEMPQVYLPGRQDASSSVEAVPEAGDSPQPTD